MTVRVLTAKLPEELVAALQDLAAQRGISRNALVREALDRVVAAGAGAGLAVEDRQLVAARATIRQELALRREIAPHRFPRSLRPDR